MRISVLIYLFAAPLLAAQLAALPALGNTSTSTVHKGQTQQTGCNYKCQLCQGWPSGQTGKLFTGRCIYNAFGSLVCQPYKVACYERWQCC